MPITRNRFSRRQAGRGIAVDVLALSPQARRYLVSVPFPTLTANVITYASFTANAACRVISVYVDFPVIPAMSSGTSAFTVDRYLVDGTTDANIVASLTVLTGFTAFIPVAPAIAAANPTSITAGQSVVVTLTTSNNTVDTNHRGGSITFLVESVEDAVISDTNTDVFE